MKYIDRRINQIKTHMFNVILLLGRIKAESINHNSVCQVYHLYTHSQCLYICVLDPPSTTRVDYHGSSLNLRGHGYISLSQAIL